MSQVKELDFFQEIEEQIRFKGEEDEFNVAVEQYAQINDEKYYSVDEITTFTENSKMVNIEGRAVQIPQPRWLKGKQSFSNDKEYQTMLIILASDLKDKIKITIWNSDALELFKKKKQNLLFQNQKFSINETNRIQSGKSRTRKSMQSKTKPQNIL